MCDQILEERVAFSSGGQRIFGNLHIPHVGAACIVTLHGLEGHKDSNKWLTFSANLLNHGYACFRFNFRGCGQGQEKSEGSFEDTNLTNRIMDFRSALDFLHNTGKVNMTRIGVIGSSLGGVVAISGADHRVKAIVAIASPYKIPRYKKPIIIREEGKHYVLPSGKKLRINFYEDLNKYDLLQIIRSVPPILIIHGDADEVIPWEHAKLLYEASSEPKKIEILKGADHIFSSDLSKVIDLALGWFKKYL